MSLNAGPNRGGAPFGDEFNEPEPSDRELADVRMQVAALLELRRPDTFRDLVTLAQRRRPPRGSAGPATHQRSAQAQSGLTEQAVVQFEIAESTGGESDYPTLVAVTELLIRIDRLPPALWKFHQAVIRLLGQLHLIAFRFVDDDSRLAEKVARLRADRTVSLARARRTLLLLRLLLLDASLSSCVTTADGIAPSGVHKPKKSPTQKSLPYTHTASEEVGARNWDQAALRVAVIDTGLTDKPRTDGELDGITPASGAEDVDPLNAFPLPNPNIYLDFAAGHGTFVAGIIRKILTPSRMTTVAIRVYRAADSDGFAFESDIAAAMVRAADDGAQLINVSCCARTVDDRPALALQAALELIAGRALVVAASGNLGGTFKMWPAAFAEKRPLDVVAVASLRSATMTEEPIGSEWSGHGPWITLSTIGEGVRSTFVEGVTEEPSQTYGPNPFARWSGTSFSAPQAAGALARLTVDKLATTPGTDPRAMVNVALSELLAAGKPLPQFGSALYILPGVQV